MPIVSGPFSYGEFDVFDNDERLSIPFPRTTQNINRGYHVTGVPKTHPVSIRFTDDDRFDIEAAARMIGVSFGEFVRWCSHYAAIEVKNEMHRRTFETKKSSKSEPDTSGYT